MKGNTISIYAFGSKYRVPKQALNKSKYLCDLLANHHRQIRTSLALQFADKLISKHHWERALKHICQDLPDNDPEMSEFDASEFYLDSTYYACILAIANLLNLHLLSQQFLEKTVCNLSKTNVLAVAKIFSSVKYGNVNNTVLDAVKGYFIKRGTLTDLEDWSQITQVLSSHMLLDIFSSNWLFCSSEFKRFQYVYNVYQTLRATSKCGMHIQEQMDSASTSAPATVDWSSILRVFLIILRNKIHYSNMSFTELMSVKSRMTSTNFRELVSEELWTKCQERFLIYKTPTRRRKPSFPKPCRFSFHLADQPNVKYFWWAGYIWELQTDCNSASLCRMLKPGNACNSLPDEEFCHFGKRQTTPTDMTFCDCKKCRAYSQHKWVLDLYPEVYAQASYFNDVFEPINVTVQDGVEPIASKTCTANEEMKFMPNSACNSLTILLEWCNSLH